MFMFIWGYVKYYLGLDYFKGSKGIKGAKGVLVTRLFSLDMIEENAHVRLNFIYIWFHVHRWIQKYIYTKQQFLYALQTKIFLNRDTATFK